MSELYGEYAVTADGRNVGRLYIRQDGLMTVCECVCEIITKDVLRLAAVSDGKYVPLGVVIPDNGALRLKKSYSKNALISMGLHNAEAFHLIRPGEVYSGSPEEVFAVRPDQEPVESDHEMKPAAVNPELIKTVERMIQQLSSEPAKTEGTAEPVQPPEPEAVITEPKHKPANSGQIIEEPREERVLHYVPRQRETFPLQASGGWRPVEKPAALFNDETIAEACEDVTGALVMDQPGLTMLAVPVSPDAPFPMMPVFCFGSSEEIGGQEYIIFKIINGYLSL